MSESNSRWLKNTKWDCIEATSKEINPISVIQEIINYQFNIPELLRQAFIRRTVQIEYKLSGCCEELEFLGDSALSLVVTKALMKEFSDITETDTEAPFESKVDEGTLSKMRSRFVCKEYLSDRCEKLGLDQYILYGTGEEMTDSAKEDALEAVIGAVAIDSDWDMNVLEAVVDRLINIQVSDMGIEESFYDKLNVWHQKHFGCMPEYVIEMLPTGPDRKNMYDCMIKYSVSENNKGIHTIQVMRSKARTKSKARERAAELAYDFIVKNGLLINLQDAGVIPGYDNCINQLQELYQHGYIEQTQYEFVQSERMWKCSAKVGNICVNSEKSSKTLAKKMAAYELLVLLLDDAGCCKKEWYDQMLEIKNSSDVVIIEAKANGGLKYAGLVSVLSQIEPGKVITEAALLKWLGEAYKIDNLQIHWREIPNVACRDESVPFHRFLSSKGLVNKWYKDALINEGHNIVETKTDNWRVLDYKETMVDVRKLRVPDIGIAIGECGNYMDNIDDEAREALMEMLKNRK